MLLGEGGVRRVSASSSPMMLWKRASTLRDSRMSCAQARFHAHTCDLRRAERCVCTMSCDHRKAQYSVLSKPLKAWSGIN